MNTLYIVGAGIVFAALCYYAWDTREKNKDLLKAFYEQQQLKNDLAARERERLDEYNFILEQSIAFVQDVAIQMNKGFLRIEGVGYEFQNDLAAISDVLQSTPKNYFSMLIGTYDPIVEAGGYNGLDVILKKAPTLKNLRYLELYVIIRIMIIQKVDLRNAAILFESNTEVGG